MNLLVSCVFIAGAAFGFAANGVVGMSFGIGASAAIIAFVIVA